MFQYLESPQGSFRTLGSDAACCCIPYPFSCWVQRSSVGMAERAWASQAVGPGHLAGCYPNGGTGFVGRDAV